MKLSAARLRFVLEAAFLVVVAAICWAAHLSWRGIVPAMAAAWALVTFVERSATRDKATDRAEPRTLFRRRSPASVEEPDAEASPPPSHVAVVGAATARDEHPPTPLPEPQPPAPDPNPPAPEPAPPAPEPEPPQPDPIPARLRAVPAAPPPAAPAAPAQEPEPGAAVTYLPRPDGPREWNVWELERIAREREGEDAARDEELTFLLLELRQFANADGQLPATFDPVVREAFGDLFAVV